jgi:hypothetical protein
MGVRSMTARQSWARARSIKTNSQQNSNGKYSHKRRFGTTTGAETPRNYDMKKPKSKAKTARRNPGRLQRLVRRPVREYTVEMWRTMGVMRHKCEAASRDEAIEIMLTHLPPDYRIVLVTTAAQAKRKRGHTYSGRCVVCKKHIYDETGCEHPKPHHYACGEVA